MEWIVLIVVLGLLFDYTNGFHDAANVISTVIATRALTPLAAILLGGVLNTIGALFIGGVAKTITSGLIDPEAATQALVLAAVIGAIVWNLLTWYFGVPSSSSYALVGGLVGAAFVQGSSGAIIWKGLLLKVVIPMVLSPLIGFLLAFLVMKILYHFLSKNPSKRAEKISRYIQIISASFLALAHGLNDAQKSMGLITLGLFAAGLLLTPAIPTWVILACAITMGLGTATGGFRIIRTVGFKITKITPIQGFAAETSASVVILTASALGMPISSTHMIVGSITGVGSARGWSAVRWMVAHRLAIAWAFTLPGSAAVAFGAHKLLLLLN
jgi:PiT family inorganic phosphate transporter